MAIGEAPNYAGIVKSPNAKGKQMLRVRFDERQCFVKIILARFVTGFARLHSARTLAEPHLRRKKLTSRLPVRAV